MRIYRRFYLVLLFVFAILCCVPALSNQASAEETEEADEPIQVLFVGNSKTAKNNIPGKFAKIASAEGKNVEVTSVAVSGKTLSYLAANKKSQLTSKAYDYVVLQEHTAKTSKYASFLSGAEAVVKLVQQQNPDVKVVIRKIWLLKDSTEEERKKAYRVTEKVAGQLDAVISEEGPAFDECEATYPKIPLYEDNRHPTREGSYLAACCVYAAIFDESPVGCTYKGGLSRHRSKRLQKIAASVSF